MDEWKSSAAKNSQKLTKDAFPRLLKKLYGKLYPTGTETSPNLVSGFRKCGIHPLNADAVLARLPDAKRGTDADRASNISSAVLDMLKSMRGVNEPVQKKRRKKIAVEPGKSISVEDMATPGTSRCTAVQGGRANVAMEMTCDTDEHKSGNNNNGANSEYDEETDTDIN